jgi:hypothetical protein
LRDTELGRRYGRWEIKKAKEIDEVKEVEELESASDRDGFGGGSIEKSRLMLP